MKQLFIAHRGNLNGPDPELENTPEYIRNALDEGFNVEIDIWYDKKEFWLGHDKPFIKLPVELSHIKQLWYHAKDICTYYYLIAARFNNVFFHENDQMAVTNNNFMWIHPNYEDEIDKFQLSQRGVMIQVLPKNIKDMVKGYCSDNIAEIRKQIKGY